MVTFSVLSLRRNIILYYTLVEILEMRMLHYYNIWEIRTQTTLLEIIRLELNRRSMSQQSMLIVLLTVLKWLFEDRTFYDGCDITILERSPYYAGWKLDCLNMSILQLDFLRRLLYNRRSMFNRLRRFYNNRLSI